MVRFTRTNLDAVPHKSGKTVEQASASSLLNCIVLILAAPPEVKRRRAESLSYEWRVNRVFRMETSQLPSFQTVRRARFECRADISSSGPRPWRRFQAGGRHSKLNATEP